MSLKDKLSKLRESLVNLGVVGSRDYEFNGVFEDHPIGNQDTYRLYYVDYHRINEYNGCDKNNIGMIDYPLKPFKFPEGMSREDGFKVLSYLTDDIEKQPDVGPYSLKAVRTLDKVLDLERFGFTRVEESDEEKILNLFTVTVRLLLFQKSKIYTKYFAFESDYQLINMTTSQHTKEKLDNFANALVNIKDNILNILNGILKEFLEEK